jgi:2-keto-3-deoxy-L-rhamnonate aldolase RhmA
MACKIAGKMCIIFAGSSEAANKYFADGFDSVAISLDTAGYINAYRDIVANILNL